MADQALTCSQCHQPFIFSTGEQEFYQSKGLKPPARCKACRSNRPQTGGTETSEARGDKR
ncbi:MAG: zinc-ribbon domain containing protein [Pirellulales bacterium]